EESELCLRLLGRGYGVRYDPRAEVEHLVDPARLDAAWFLRRAFWTGWGAGFIDARYQALRKVARRVRWHYRRALHGLPHAASSAATWSSSRPRLHRSCRSSLKRAACRFRTHPSTPSSCRTSWSTSIRQLAPTSCARLFE